VKRHGFSTCHHEADGDRCGCLEGYPYTSWYADRAPAILEIRFCGRNLLLSNSWDSHTRGRVSLLHELRLSAKITNLLCFYRIKTRIQLDPVTYNNGLIGTFRQVIAKEGAQALLTGLGPTVVGYFLQGALRFGGYEFFKKQSISCTC